MATTKSTEEELGGYQNDTHDGAGGQRLALSAAFEGLAHAPEALLFSFVHEVAVLATSLLAFSLGLGFRVEG